MRRRVVHVLAVVFVAATLGGCGHMTAAETTTVAATTSPTLTSASDRAACNQLEANIRVVSDIVSNSVHAMTQSLHPKELARRTGDAQETLLASASVLSLIAVPTPLEPARHRLVDGLHRFARDFGRARKSVERNDIATAAAQLIDRPALAEVAAATRKIDRACGA